MGGPLRELERIRRSAGANWLEVEVAGPSATSSARQRTFRGDAACMVAASAPQPMSTPDLWPLPVVWLRPVPDGGHLILLWIINIILILATATLPNL